MNHLIAQLPAPCEDWTTGNWAPAFMSPTNHVKSDLENLVEMLQHSNLDCNFVDVEEDLGSIAIKLKVIEIRNNENVILSRWTFSTNGILLKVVHS